MSRNPISEALTPDLPAVAKALANPKCRELIRALDRPMTAAELAAACDVPRSTAYEKLDLLVETGLVQRRERDAEARYLLDFREVVVTEQGGELAVSVRAPSRSATEQLTELWSEVRTEAGGS